MLIQLASGRDGSMGRGKNIRDYLRVKEAAEYLGVSPSTVRNWERDGKLAAYRNPMNKYRLFRKSDLDALLDEIRGSGAEKEKAD